MLKLLKHTPLTVVKVGGSLFPLSDLGDRLEKFLKCSDFGNVVIIAGGGPFADAVRVLDQSHQLSSESSHELGVRVLSISGRFLACLSDKLRWAETAFQVSQAWENCRFPVLDIAGLVLQHSTLPASWDVTSDSLAAWAATLNAQSRLILLKSVELTVPICTAKAAAEMGFVDKFFPHVSQNVTRIDWVNLRSSLPEVTHWK